MSNGYEALEWAHDHRNHRIILTETALPYPKKVHYRRKDGSLRPAFARYVFMVAHEGRTIGELMKNADKLYKIRMYYKPEIDHALKLVERKSSYEEVVRCLRNYIDQHLHQAEMEVPYCYNKKGPGWYWILPRSGNLHHHFSAR